MFSAIQDELNELNAAINPAMFFNGRFHESNPDEINSHRERLEETLRLAELMEAGVFDSAIAGIFREPSKWQRILTGTKEIWRIIKER